MKKIVYSRYGNDRGEQFRIRTDILEDENGKKYVQKTALSDKAEKHITNIFNSCELLTNQYKNTKFCVNQCKKIDEKTLEFDFLEGKGLETILDEYLYSENIQGFLAVIDEYKKQMEYYADTEFKITDGFREIFGNLSPNEGQPAMAITNIDQIFQNIIVFNDKWYIYDYEWTVPFPLPLKYVFYRCAFFYGEFERKSFLQDKVNLMRYFQINGKEKRLFEQMEDRMQAYILSGHTPLWDIYSLISPKNYYPIGMIMEAGIQNAASLITVRKVYEDGRNEELTINPTPDVSGKYVFEIALSQDLNILQIVPAQGPCMMVVHMMNLRGAGAEEKEYVTNGIDMGNGLVCFPAGNARIWMDHFGKQYHTLHVEITVSVLDNSILTACSNYILTKSKYIEKQREEIEKLLGEKGRHIEAEQNMIYELEKFRQENADLALSEAQYRSNYDCISNSFCWKLTKPIRKILDKVKGR